MALTLNFFIGRLLNRNEKVTTAKINAMVKGMSANLSGSVGTANIDDGAVTPAKTQPGAYWYATAILGGTTYTAAFTPAVAGYADGLFLAFKAGSANAGACSFDAGAGAKPLTKWGGSALEANDILAGEIVTVHYNSTLAAGSWELVNTPRTPVADRTLIGSVTTYAGAAAPAGWLECDGSAVARATYAALFTAIGTAWGPGDGVTTFNLPDLRGYFIRGYDHGAGIDPARVLGSVQADDIKPHTHFIANTDNLNNTLPALTASNRLATTASGGGDNPDYQLCGTATAATIGLTSNAAGNAHLATVALHAGGGGAGYAVNDVLTINGGTGTAATVRVTSVAVGVITGVVVQSGGDYTVNPGLVANAATGGSGAGASLDLTVFNSTESRPKNVAMMFIIKT